MEQGSEGQENNQKINHSSKSSGSLIRIDAISINLFNDMDNHQDANQCDHFSLRGYVAEMRKKDIGVCLPFCTVDKWNESEEKSSILPPLDVVKSKLWSCLSCLHKIGAACCAEDIGKLSECSPGGFAYKGSCSFTEPSNDEVRGAHVNKDEVGPGQNGEVRAAHVNKDEVGPGQSLTDGSGNDAYHQAGPLVKDIVNSQALVLPKRHADGSDIMEFYGPSNIGHLGNSGCNSAKICQTETSYLPNNQPLNVLNSDIMPKVSSWSIPGMEGTKGKASASQLLDDFSSESRDINPKGDTNDKFKVRSTKSVCERTPKIRLLTELLRSGRNGENDQSRSTDSDSDSDSASDFCNGMTVQALQKKHSKGKRKITQEENGTPLSSPKKSKLSKAPVHFAKRNCMVVDSNEERSGTFTQQKNLKNHLLSKKKHKQIQHGCESPIMPRPDVAKRKQFSPTEGLSKPVHPVYTNTETHLYYKSSTSPQKSNMSKKKNKQVGVWKAVVVPQSSTMSREGLSITKDSVAYGKKGVDLSFKGYGISDRNVEDHIAKDMIGDEQLLLPWNSAARERFHQVKDTIHPMESFCKPAPDQGSGKGLLYDLNEKIPTHSSVGDMQNAGPRIGGSNQHHQDLNISGVHNSEPKYSDEDRGNEDIPMDIVELMAKNQYDRRRHESEKIYFDQDNTNEKRNSELIGIHGKGVLKSYQVEDHSVRKSLSAVKSNEHSAPVKANSMNSFSDLSLSSLSMTKTEGKKTAFAKYSAFFDHQRTQSGTVSYPESGSIRNGDYQNFQWKGDNIGSSFSPLAAGYPLIPSYTKFPQSYVTQGINFVTNSQVLESTGRGKQANDLDLNFVNDKYNNFEKREKVYGFESLPNKSVVDPSASKYTGIDLNVDVSETLDLDCNETIPAMQLLSLMDAGMKSNLINNSVGNQNMISKQFNTCSYHPKVLEKPPFLSGYHYKEPLHQAIGLFSNASRPTTSSSSGKNQWRDVHSCECPPPIPMFGSFSSAFQNKGNLVQVGNGIPARAPPKFEGKRKGHAQSSNGKLQKPLLNNTDSNSMLDNQRGSQYMKETVSPSLDIGNSELCFVNRNPADFSIPEPGNKYMINGRDIKFAKKISSKGKQGVTNVEGRKRQKVKVPTTTKTQ